MTKYVCINCGVKVKALYKKYNASVLKLISCENCNNVVDKYIEYDPVITIIDLVLLNKEAYRHVLYNTDFKVYWKLSIMLLLMEAYSEYKLNALVQNDLKENANYLGKEDLVFYRILLKTLIQAVSFSSTISLLTFLYSRITQKCNYSFVMTWKTIILSTFGIFLLFPSLIWNNNPVQEFHITFVYLYTILSQLLAYTVVCECPKTWSIFVIVISYYTKTYSLYFLNKFLM